MILGDVTLSHCPLSSSTFKLCILHHLPVQHGQTHSKHDGEGPRDDEVRQEESGNCQNLLSRDKTQQSDEASRELGSSKQRRMGDCKSDCAGVPGIRTHECMFKQHCHRKELSPAEMKLQ